MLSTDKYSNPDMPKEQDQAQEPAPAYNHDVTAIHMVPVPTSIIHVVDTRTVAAPMGGAHTVTLVNSRPNLILPNDHQRRSATVLAVDAPVFIATTLEEAQASAGTTNGTAGFYLPIGIPVTIPTTSPFWAAPTSATLARVSVMTFRDAA